MRFATYILCLTILVVVVIGCFGCKSLNAPSHEDWASLGQAEGYTNSAKVLDSMFEVYHQLGSRHLKEGDYDSAKIESGRMKVCLEMSDYLTQRSIQIVNKLKNK